MRYPWKGEYYSFSYAADFYLKPARTKKGISIPSATLGHQLKLIEKKVRSLDEKNPRFLQNIITVEKEFSSIAIKIYKLIDKKKLLCYRKKPIAKFRNAYLLWGLYQEMLRLIGFLQKKQVLFQANNIITYSCHFTKEKVTHDNSNDFFFADNRFFKKDFIQIFLFLGAKKKKKSIGSAILEYTKPNTPDIFATDEYRKPNTHWIVRSLMVALEDDWLAMNPHKETIDAKSRKSSCNYSLPSIWDIYNSATKFPGAFKSFLFSKSGARFAAGALTTRSEPTRNERFGQPQFQYSLGSASHGLSSHGQTSNTPSFIPFGTVPREYVGELPLTPCQRDQTISSCYEEIESKNIFAWSDNEKELLEWFRSIDNLKAVPLRSNGPRGVLSAICTFPKFELHKAVHSYTKAITVDDEAINKFMCRSAESHEDIHGMTYLFNMYSGNCYCDARPYNTEEGRRIFRNATLEMGNYLRTFAKEYGLNKNLDTAEMLSKQLSNDFKRATGLPFYVSVWWMTPKIEKSFQGTGKKVHDFSPYEYLDSHPNDDVFKRYYRDISPLFNRNLKFNAHVFYDDHSKKHSLYLSPKKEIDTMMVAIFSYFILLLNSNASQFSRYIYRDLIPTEATIIQLRDTERIPYFREAFSPEVTRFISPKLSEYLMDFYAKITDIKNNKRNKYLEDCKQYFKEGQSRVLDDSLPYFSWSTGEKWVYKDGTYTKTGEHRD